MDEPAMSLLVLGGARSGKSRYAQSAAERSGLAPVFVATAQAWDEEMSARIRLHVAARDARWRKLDAPYALGEALVEAAGPETIVLVDCLTLWLSNLMLRGDEPEGATAELAAFVAQLAGPAIFVSNEVGAGIVPDTVLGRRFRDAQGRLNQALASVCTTVVHVTAGLPIQLKPRPEPVLAF